MYRLPSRTSAQTTYEGARFCVRYHGLRSLATQAWVVSYNATRRALRDMLLLEHVLRWFLSSRLAPKEYYIYHQSV